VHKRFVALAAGLSCLLVMVAPAIATAAPRHNHGLTINAVPNPIIAGEAALIYGQLKGPASAGQTIFLYHRINPASSFSLIGKTATNAMGFYEFTRAEGILLSNRSWFVRGPSATHSRTVHERVTALVSLAASETSSTTGRPVVFTGSVTPGHRFQRVVLQEQAGSSGSVWTTIATTFTGGGSSFTVAHRWMRPGEYTLRALFKGDARNVAGASDSLTVVVQQTEKPAFTISSSAPTITEGQSVTISGVLYEVGTTTPKAMKQVTLYGNAAGEPPVALATTTTGPEGGYSFTQTPIHNEVYQVTDTLNPGRTTADLYEGVQDLLSINASSMTSTVGGTETISGIVAPDKAGHVISLQRQGGDGNWHEVQRGVVVPGSTYSFAYTFGQAGTVELRARIFGGPENVGAASSPVTIAVSGIAPVTSLPPAS
jgi:hypothetical protein